MRPAYGAVPLPSEKATNPWAKDPYDSYLLWVGQAFVLFLWIVALCVVLPLTLLGVMHYVLIDLFLFAAAASSLYLVYVYGTTLNSCCCLFSVTGGTQLLCLVQLIPMLFYVAVETNNIFVAVFRGHGFVATTWFTQLLGSFGVLVGLPFVVAGLYGASYKYPTLVKVFLFYLVGYFFLSLGLMAAAMYKGPDICAYYAILGAAKCGQARLTELGVMAFDLSFQIYCIWVVKSCVEYLQGNMDGGFGILLAGTPGPQSRSYP